MTTSPVHDVPRYVTDALRGAIQIGSALPADPAAGDRATQDLTEALYAEWYVRPEIGKPQRLPPHGNWIEVLRAAHHGSYCWEPGWRAVRVSSAGRVVARRADEERLLTTSDYIVPDRPGLPPTPGLSIEVVSRWDSTEVFEGFWITQTGAWASFGGPILRLYWNVDIAGAPLLVRAITEEISPGVPYSFKLPSDPGAYDRVDVAVLYCPCAEFEALAPALRTVHDRIRAHLHDEVPKLSRRLARGLAVAEDPSGPNDSFGLHRCRLIAVGLLDAAGARESDPSRIERMICERFLEAGVSPVTPHLNSAHSRDYRL